MEERIHSTEKLLYSMGEVAEMFDVNQSLIRFWEKSFDIIKPQKNKKGNRQFSPKDIENLKMIYHLVKERGMTIEGANKLMKSNPKGIERDAEVADKLQRIKAILLEIKAELNEIDGAEIEKNNIVEIETIEETVECEVDANEEFEIEILEQTEANVETTEIKVEDEKYAAERAVEVMVDDVVEDKCAADGEGEGEGAVDGEGEGEGEVEVSAEESRKMSAEQQSLF